MFPFVEGLEAVYRKGVRHTGEKGLFQTEGMAGTLRCQVLGLDQW